MVWNEISEGTGLRFRARGAHERHHVRDPGLGEPPNGGKALDNHEPRSVLYPKPVIQKRGFAELMAGALVLPTFGKKYHGVSVPIAPSSTMRPA